MLMRKIFLITAVVLMALTARPQHRHPVCGRVVDEYGKPLPGVRVHSKGAANDVFTNTEVDFHIEALIGKVLVFSHARFDEEQRMVRGDTLAPIRLMERFIFATGVNPAVSRNDTIVIPDYRDEKLDVLYGESDRESFLGSISTVNKKALEATPATNYLFAL